jgi:hypothetical protein
MSRITVTGHTGLDPLVTSARNLDLDVSIVFTGRGLLPSIVTVANGPFGWTEPGAIRTLTFSDGGTAVERLTAYEPGVRYAYDLTGFTNLLRFLVSGAHIEWRYRPAGDGGTTIDREFTFHPLPGRAGIVRVLVARPWKHYMDDILRRVVAQIQTGVSS